MTSMMLDRESDYKKTTDKRRIGCVCHILVYSEESTFQKKQQEHVNFHDQLWQICHSSILLTGKMHPKKTQALIKSMNFNKKGTLGHFLDFFITMVSLLKFSREILKLECLS